MTQAYAPLSANDMPETVMAFPWARKVGPSNSRVKSWIKQRKLHSFVLTHICLKDSENITTC